MFDLDQCKKRDEIYIYLLDKLTKANERPSPVVAAEMTEWLMKRFSSISSNPESGGIIRILGREPSQSRQVLDNLKVVLGDPQE